MRQSLFGRTGYGFDAPGTEESLAKLQPADLKSFHQKLVTPNNCVLAIFGDINPADIKASVEKAFAGWQPNPAASIDLSGFKPRTAGAPIRTEELRDKKQAVIVIGFPGTTLQGADRYALELVQESCSDL